MVGAKTFGRHELFSRRARMACMTVMRSAAKYDGLEAFDLNPSSSC